MIKLGDKIIWGNTTYTCVDFRAIFKDDAVTRPFAMVDRWNSPMTWCCDSLKELQEELDVMKEKYRDKFKYM